jgi:membrane fusion protein (multidrug efflux system)
VRVVAPDGKVQIKAITLGERIGTRWIVEKGIEAGDRVIVDSGQLAAGTKVNTKPFAADAAASTQGSN